MAQISSILRLPPSSPAPKAVVQALIEAMGDGDTHGYSVAKGVPALRDAISAHYAKSYDATISPDQIAVTVGSSTAFALSFLAAFDVGDRVALPTPGYPAYRNLMMAMGIEPVALPARAEQSWMPSLREMESWDKLPDGIIIASPHNPTGVILSEEEMSEICDWCHKHSVRLISDEIYHGLSYGKQATTAAHYNKDAIIVSGFSKYFSMTGWRLGWMVIPQDLTPTVERLIANLYISAPTPNQMGAIHAFDATPELDANLARYAENRAILLDGLAPEFLGNHAPCDGAFIFMWISQRFQMIVRNSQMTSFTVEVAVTAGVDFDPEQGHKHLRLSFAGATKDMHEAVSRINAFIKEHIKTQKSA